MSQEIQIKLHMIFLV